MAVQLRILKFYQWSTLLYSCEAWALSSVMIKILEAFETWLYRKKLRISWTDRITNDEVYRGRRTIITLLGDIARRHLSFIVHVLRKTGKASSDMFSRWQTSQNQTARDLSHSHRQDIA